MKGGQRFSFRAADNVVIRAGRNEIDQYVKQSKYQVARNGNHDEKRRVEKAEQQQKL